MESKQSGGWWISLFRVGVVGVLLPTNFNSPHDQYILVIFPQKHNLVSSAVKEILSFRQTDGQLSVYFYFRYPSYFYSFFIFTSSGEKKDKGHNKENKAEKREKKVKKKVYTDEEKKAFIEKTKKFKVDKKKLGGGKKFKKTDNPLESKTKKLEKVYFT